jgi:hypothetical protein
MGKSNSFPKDGKRLICIGSKTFRIGVLVDNFGGDIEYQFGTRRDPFAQTPQTGMFLLPVLLTLKNGNRTRMF